MAVGAVLTRTGRSVPRERLLQEVHGARHGRPHLGRDRRAGLEVRPFDADDHQSLRQVAQRAAELDGHREAEPVRRERRILEERRRGRVQHVEGAGLEAGNSKAEPRSTRTL
jgi:hypothetical protein